MTCRLSFSRYQTIFAQVCPKTDEAKKKNTFRWHYKYLNRIWNVWCVSWIPEHWNTRRNVHSRSRTSIPAGPPTAGWSIPVYTCKKMTLWYQEFWGQGVLFVGLLISPVMDFGWHLSVLGFKTRVDSSLACYFAFAWCSSDTPLVLRVGNILTVWYFYSAPAVRMYSYRR